MKILVPYSQRSASTSLVNIPRGSRLKVDPASPFIRLFTYWKAPVDIDLGAVLLDEKFRTLDTISYYNLSSYGRSVHSGDIRNGSHGAVEFIDLDVKAFKAKKLVMWPFTLRLIQVNSSLLWNALLVSWKELNLMVSSLMRQLLDKSLTSHQKQRIVFQCCLIWRQVNWYGLTW